MPISPDEEKRRISERQPIKGWIDEDDGWFRAPKSAFSRNIHQTPWSKALARRTRARADLFEYVKNASSNL